MIIYATEIFFEPPTAMEALLEPIADWMSGKLKRHTIVDDLGTTTSFQYQGHCGKHLDHE